MKISLLTTFAVVIGFFDANAAEIRGKVTACGIVHVSGKYHKVDAPDTASRVARYYGELPVLKEATSHIPARIGTQFGVFYEISNVPGAAEQIELVHVRKSPDRRGPDGTVYRGSESPVW